MASQLEDRYDERITGNCFGRRPGVRAKEHDRHHFFQHRGYASASDLTAR